MPALIYVNLAHVRPVIDGVWHRAELTVVPAPGEVITMLCGQEAVAEFEPHDRRLVRCVPTQCLACDEAYREQLGWISRKGPGGRRTKPKQRRPR